MAPKADLDRTIEELEGERWSDSGFPSHLVSECQRLRKVPLRLFTIENLRILLGQNIGSRYLVPVALERLEAEPFAEGDFYPGDLLCNLLSLPQGFWAENPRLRDRAAAVAATAMTAIGASSYAHGAAVAKRIRKAHAAFTAGG